MADQAAEVLRAHLDRLPRAPAELGEGDAANVQWACQLYGALQSARAREAALREEVRALEAKLDRDGPAPTVLTGAEAMEKLRPKTKRGRPAAPPVETTQGLGPADPEDVIDVQETEEASE